MTSGFLQSTKRKRRSFWNSGVPDLLRIIFGSDCSIKTIFPVPAKELRVPAAGTEPHYGRPVADSAQAAAGAALVMVICEHCHHCTSPTSPNIPTIPSSMSSETYFGKHLKKFYYLLFQHGFSTGNPWLSLKSLK